MKYLKGSIDFSKFQKLENLYITVDAEIDILNIDTGRKSYRFPIKKH